MNLGHGTIIVEGILKGWDQLLNLVLDDTQELMRGAILHQCRPILFCYP